MAIAKDILTEEFEALKEELIAQYDAQGMRASGAWADSLEVKTTDRKAQILGLPYSQQLETGRQAGKQPPSEAIEQWIINKGIAATIQGKITISSLAFLIARKIGREGWKREQFGGVELISKVVTPERIQQIIDRLSDVYLVEFSNDLIGYLKEAA